MFPIPSRTGRKIIPVPPIPSRTGCEQCFHTASPPILGEIGSAVCQAKSDMHCNVFPYMLVSLGSLNADPAGQNQDVWCVQAMACLSRSVGSFSLSFSRILAR